MANEHENVDNFLEIRTMSDEEMAEAWATEHKISGDAIEKLFKEGFNSLDAIRLIDADDLARTKIARGQQKLIIVSVQKLLGNYSAGNVLNTERSTSAAGNVGNEQAISAQPAQATSGEQTANQSEAALPVQNNGGLLSQQAVAGEDDPYLRALVQQLQTGQSAARLGTTSNSDAMTLSGIGIQPQTGQLIQNNVPSVQSWRDPQIYLSRAANGKSPHSHYDITDFVAGSMEEEIVVGGNGTQQVVLKSGPKKPKIENVTLAQWSVASNAILYRLVNESKLDSSNILDYISYATKICELVQRYTLLSVLLYDRNYRQVQAQSNFRWGTDVPHLQNVHLIPRIPRPAFTTGQKNQTTQPQRSQSNQGPLTLDGKTICKLYNSKAGCHYKECRYVHQCSYTGCYQAHAAGTHYQKN